MPLNWDTVWSLEVYILLLPFYFYGFKKWYEWRKHCLFRLRYSYPQGLFLIIVALSLVHITIIRNILDDVYDLANAAIYGVVVSSGIFMIYGVIYYRALLTLLEYKQHQSRLFQMNIIEDTKANTLNATTPRKHYASRILIFAYFICVLANILLRLANTVIAVSISNMLFPLQFVVAIVLYIVVKMNKVRELIGCLLETYITFAMSVVMVAFIAISPDYATTQFCGYVFFHLWALCTIYSTLFCIYKSGTHDIHTRLNGAPSNEVKSFSENQLSLDSLSREEIKTEIKEIQQDINSKPLLMFLTDQKDYEIFSKYLAYCFCLENLMFIQRVCVFRWLIINKMEDKTGTMQVARADKYCYSLKFEFANKMYQDYSQMMIKQDKEEDDIFKSDRVGLCRICNDIYNEFITNDSVNQINIPHATQLGLIDILGSDAYGDTSTKFESYQDFLNVFDDAIYHVWHLLDTVYQFRFATYFKPKVSTSP